MRISKLLHTARIAVITMLLACLLLSNATIYAQADEDRLTNLRLPWLDYNLQLSCSANGSSTDLDAFLKALALHESSGNPKAQNPGSSASGKYQYISSTWQSRSSLYGPAGQYSTAASAPEAVQDAVAYIEYAQKFAGYDGDVEKLAMSHFQPAVASSPERWDELAPGNNNGMTYRDYMEGMTSKIGTPEAEAIPLLYAQAPDFETWVSKADIDTSTAGSAGGCAAGIENFIFYKQFDGRWGSQLYGGATMAAAGCGPTSMAMVIATLKDKNVTPADVGSWGNANGHSIPGGGGSQWSLFSAGASNWGLKSQELFTTNGSTRPTSADMNAVMQVLKSGGLVIASGTGAAPFTIQGHIIVIRGVTDDGKFLVGDPADQQPQDTPFEASKLTPYIRGLWGITN